VGGEWKREDGVPEAPLSTLHSPRSTPHPISTLHSTISSPEPLSSLPSAISALLSPLSTPSRPCSSRPRNPGLSDLILSG